jgi:hypothetical protein
MMLKRVACNLVLLFHRYYANHSKVRAFFLFFVLILIFSFFSPFNLPLIFGDEPIMMQNLNMVLKLSAEVQTLPRRGVSNKNLLTASQQQQVLRVFDDDGSFTGHQALAVYEQQQRQMQRARALMQQQQYGNQRMDDCCPPPPCCCPPPPCCCPPPPCCCDDVGDAPDVLDMFEQRVS